MLTKLTHFLLHASSRIYLQQANCLLFLYTYVIAKWPAELRPISDTGFKVGSQAEPHKRSVEPTRRDALLDHSLMHIRIR